MAAAAMACELAEGTAMSVFRKPGSRFWWYNFQIKGRRYTASTKMEMVYEALASEREARLHAKHGLWDKLHPRKLKLRPRKPVRLSPMETNDDET
jgi:hypothetical protein